MADRGPGDATLVSCLMVALPSHVRLPWFRQSVADYCRQTHPRRELVVLLDRGDPSARDALVAHLDALGRDDIRVIESPEKRTLGALRNAVIALARGEIVCQWDDDDRSHPERIAAGLAAMARAGARAMCLEETFLYFTATRALHWISFHMTPERAFPGSLMMRRDVAPTYPETGPKSMKGEDSAGLAELMRTGGYECVAGAPHLCVYVSHGANTSGDVHMRMVADKLSLSRALLARREAEIRNGISAHDFGPGDIAVTGYNGVAFTLSAPGASSPRRTDTRSS